MRFLMILTVGFCLLFASVPAMADQAADEAAIRKAAKQSIESDNKRDIEAHLAVYADPLISFQTKTDRAAHKKLHTDAWARQKDVHLKMLDEIDIVFLSPDVAIYRFSQESTGRLDENGKSLPPMKTAIARVYVKIDGKWLTKARFPMDIEE